MVLRAKANSEKDRLQHARTKWCVVAFEVLTKNYRVGMPMGELDKFIGKLAGVPAREIRRVRAADSHLSQEAIDRLEAGLGIYAEFHRAAVMSPDFEEGLREAEYHQSLQESSRRRRRGL
jgi:hypothetical protein